MGLGIALSDSRPDQAVRAMRPRANYNLVSANWARGLPMVLVLLLVPILLYYT